MKIGIVGPCAAGKTTLANNLAKLGFDARAIGQEHSQVQTMWRQMTHPDILIYLEASLQTICARLNVVWEQNYLDEQNRRLGDARAHADFTLATDGLEREEVLVCVVDFLETRSVFPQ
jgi:deoxyadenosine/deoxycytidine kinase